MGKKREPITYDWSSPLKALKSFWLFIWYDDSLLGWIANIIVAFIFIKFIFFPGLGLVFGTDFPIVAVVSESMEHTGSFDDWWTQSALCDNGPCTQELWYAQNNITQEQFKTFPFKNGFNKGDVMILFGVQPKDVQLGDVIVYDSLRKYPIIHRVVKILPQADGSYIFNTKGDNNDRMWQQYIIINAVGSAYTCVTQVEDAYIPASCRARGAQPITKDTPGALKDLDEYNVLGDEVYGRAVFRIPFIGYVKIWATDLFWGFINLFA